MKHLKLLLFIILIMTNHTYSQESNPLNQILNNNPQLFSAILQHPTQNEVQILYTQINRDKNNQAHFETYSYNLNNQHYFYPASTVKLPAAIFALEKLNEMNKKGLNKYSTLKIDSNYTGQTTVEKDETSENGLPSIAHYIKKILLVSDNDAFNRIYEFADRAYINAKLKNYGFKNSRIVNRLAIGDSGESAKYTNPIHFYNKDELIYTKPSAYDQSEYPIELNNLIRGKGYLDANDQLVNKPFDFSGKNVFQLSDQHELMKRLFFPENYKKKERFNLSAADYDFLYTYMSKYPTESDYPKYSKPDYFPAYCKFLFYGADENAVINPDIRIFNKVGDSYGYTLDNMYFVDYKNKVEFILTAVIQSNNNDIYNDNQYEYQTVCFPFMKNLGQKVYELELKREKTYLPDFKHLLNYK